MNMLGTSTFRALLCTKSNGAHSYKRTSPSYLPSCSIFNSFWIH